MKPNTKGEGRKKTRFPAFERKNEKVNICLDCMTLTLKRMVC